MPVSWAAKPNAVFTPTKNNSLVAKSSNLIFLIGELSLVKELGEICHQRGFSVAYKLNEKSATTALPKFFERTATVPRNAMLAVELTNTDISLKQKNLRTLDKAIPATKIILSSSVTVSVSEQLQWLKHPQRIIGMSGLPTLLSQKLVEVASSLQTDRRILSQALDFFMKLGTEVSVVEDRVGMIMPRILCMIINEAFFAVKEGIASPQDIDTAMKLGTNYPLGPLEWAEKIGLRQVYSVLNAIHQDLGEERYRIAPMLKQMANSSTC